MFDIYKSEWRENIESIAIAVVTILFIMIFVAQPFLVKGHSMEPTLLDGERLIVCKFIFQLREPQTGDVVVIIPPGDPHRKYIKRVIAGSSQTISIENSRVYVDGQELNEPYIKEKTFSNYSLQEVPADSVFVMGDNRNNSTDSRMSVVGFVPLKNVVGKAVLVFWPIFDLKILFNPDYSRSGDDFVQPVENYDSYRPYSGD